MAAAERGLERDTIVDFWRIIRYLWCQTGANLAADGDGSGTVGLGDYNIWKSQFGMHAESGMGLSAAVPESGTGCLAVIGAVFCLPIGRFFAGEGRRSQLA